MKHTEKPWIADGETITLGNGKKIYASAANARLIAAAPELLEALRFVLADTKVLHGSNLSLRAVDTIVTAIAKATGGNS